MTTAPFARLKAPQLQSRRDGNRTSEPSNLYVLFGRPGLGTGMLMGLAIIGGACLIPASLAFRVS
jgi:hypothetical protein